MTQLSMTGRLMVKDWSFNRWPISLFVAGGAASLAVVAWGGLTGFFVGSILLLVAVMSVGMQLVFTTVIYERKEQTLPFIMSLPITSAEYVTAKILANVTIFLGAWMALAAMTILVILGRDALPNGLIPFAVLILLELFMGYAVILAVALMTESEGWTIFAMVVSNIFLNFFMYKVSHIPAIAAVMNGPDTVWPRAAVSLLAGEIGVIVLLVVATYAVQVRKKDFL